MILENVDVLFCFMHAIQNLYQTKKNAKQGGSVNVPSPEPQINSAYHESATKRVLHPKVATSERQSLLILIINATITFRPGAVLYIGVLAMAKSLFKTLSAHNNVRNNDSTKVP